MWIMGRGRQGWAGGPEAVVGTQMRAADRRTDRWGGPETAKVEGAGLGDPCRGEGVRGVRHDPGHAQGRGDLLGC